MPMKSEPLLYCDHIDQDGEGMFRLACENDLEGFVAKRKSDPYLTDHATWLKVRNHDYSPWVGGRSYSNGSAVAILIFTFGMVVPWLPKRSQMREAVSATSEAQSAVHSLIEAAAAALHKGYGNPASRLIIRA